MTGIVTKVKIMTGVDVSYRYLRKFLMRCDVPFLVGGFGWYVLSDNGCGLIMNLMLPLRVYQLG